MLEKLTCVALLALTGCYSCSRHVSTVRPDVIRPAPNITSRYRLAELTVVKPSLGAGEDVVKAEKYHAEDTANIFAAVKKSLYANYPAVFVDSGDAIPLTVNVNWSTRYQGSPIVQSPITYMVMPEDAEQETVYYVTTTAWPTGNEGPWTEKTSAARYSETWETWLLPIGYIPIPGKSDWSRTFGFMRLGKDSIVGNPSKTINSKCCIRDLVFEPKVDGDVIAAAIMRAINRRQHAAEIAALQKQQQKKKGGAK